MDELIYRRIKDYFNSGDNVNYVTHCGVEVLEISQGYCKARVKLSEKCFNPYGIAHGGLLYTLNDTATGIAAITTGKTGLTLSANINYLKPASHGFINCEAKEIRAGRTTGLYDAEVRNEDGDLVCRAGFTYFFTGVMDEDYLEKHFGKSFSNRK